jgi:hypothetical protein
MQISEPDMIQGGTFLQLAKEKSKFELSATASFWGENYAYTKRDALNKNV